MQNLSIQWHFFGSNKHAIIEYDDCTEIVGITPVSKKVAELLISKGMNSGS